MTGHFNILPANYSGTKNVAPPFQSLEKSTFIQIFGRPIDLITF